MRLLKTRQCHDEHATCHYHAPTSGLEPEARHETCLTKKRLTTERSKAIGTVRTNGYSDDPFRRSARDASPSKGTFLWRPGLVGVG